MTTPRTAPGTGQPTLDEVARVAGVSRATASRAINGGQRVSARAQSAVDTAVRSLGYVPNPAARSLVTRRTDSIAVVVPEPDDRVFSDPFFAGTLRGVNRVLTERDIQLVLLLARRGGSSSDPSSLDAPEVWHLVRLTRGAAVPSFWPRVPRHELHAIASMLVEPYSSVDAAESWDRYIQGLSAGPTDPALSSFARARQARLARAGAMP